ncbi:MAG: aspartyl protease family protein [Clostridiales bacterium]|nr:aspartyl protease family protein [Clostridiales bacterium]
MDSNKFWSKIKNFNYGALKKEELLDEQDTFLQAIKAIDTGDKEKSVELLTKLYRDSNCQETINHSARLLFQQLFWADRFDKIKSLELDTMEAIEESYRKISVALEQNKNKNITFSSESYKDKLEFSISGSPIVGVEINGIKKDFWLDTGALLSVLSQETADLCQVRTDSNDEVIANSSTNEEMSVKFGWVENANVGNLSVENTPFIILPTENLTFADPSIEGIIKIDGIIGWDFIKYMNLKLDYKNGEYEIIKPVGEDVSNSNIIMDGYVIVRINCEKDNSLYFGVDTGASSTSFNECIFDKIKLVEVKKETKRVGGVSGFKEVEQKIIPKLKLKINKTEIELSDVANTLHKPCDFFELDGIVGSDLFRDGCLRIDYRNGIFEVIK